MLYGNQSMLKPLREGKVQPLVVFGGQACSDNLLGELKALLNADYQLKDFYLRLAKLLKELSEGKDAKDMYLYGFDLEGWLGKLEAEWPSKEYILSAPVSLPLIGVIQLLNYYAILKMANLSPMDLAEFVKGATGHSQGIVPAAVVALAKTMQEFMEGAEAAVRMLFWIGLRAQQAFPRVIVSQAVREDCIASGAGEPSPMMAIKGLDRVLLEKFIAKTNASYEDPREKLVIGLQNAHKTFVVCGNPNSLYSLLVALKAVKAEGEDQSRVPYTKRKLDFHLTFLPISTAFHCELLSSAVDRVVDDLAKANCTFFDKPSQFVLPLFHTELGATCGLKGLGRSLVEQICVLPVHWPKVISGLKDISHIFEFGPGNASGIGGLTRRNIEGTGVEVVLAGAIEPIVGFSTREDLLNGKLQVSASWKDQFQAKLVKANGELCVDTRFSRLLGKPPVMVAGMTPCTVPEPFVSACIQAGYHVELSGGGHFNEEVLRAKIDAIIEKVGVGCTITLNSLFLNPRLWAIQYPVMKRMRQEGYPIEGFCVAAGVPSFDSAVEIVESMREVGIRHVSFKPGSKQTILEVVKIAHACPRMPIVLQWTGGRGGGHHSFEDFHEPLLETYSAIRSAPNLILVVGSGFGDGQGSWPYISGDWSLAYGKPAMPVDGILLGSRMMVAAENQASQSVKDLIVAAPGIENEQDWVTTYNKPIGGVVTVRSELGEPIHKIATRGVLFWKELDDTIFNLPAGEKRLAAIKARRDSIISKLNADHQKVWFGARLDGTICDLTEMTYYEVAKRLGQLVYVWHQKRWIDVTYKKLMELFLHRIEERFLGKDSSVSRLSDHSDWFRVDGATIYELNPWEVIDPFFEHYPQARDAIINYEDCQAFLSMCMIPWHKPVPFIPTLDDDRLEYWFKKDSLWQSEDVEAVMDQDVQRVAILHGPVAAKYSKKANETVKEILDGIKDYYLGQLSSSHAIEEEWFGGHPIKYSEQLGNICCTECINHSITTVIVCQPPEPITTCDWLDMLSGPGKTWIRALLRSPVLVKGPKAHLPNRIRSLFKPRLGFTAKLAYDKQSEKPIEISMLDGNGNVQVEATFDAVTKIIQVRVPYKIHADSEERKVPFKIMIQYCPEDPYALIKEVGESHLDLIKSFYWSVWFGAGADMAKVKSFSPMSDVIEASSVIDSDRVERFNRIVGCLNSVYKDCAPMDYCMVAAWEPVMQILFCDAIQGDLLRLVHLSNSIENLSGDAKLTLGSAIKIKARALSIQQGDSGKTVSVEAICCSGSDSKPLVRVQSDFFFREDKEKLTAPVLFDRSTSEDLLLKVNDAVDLEILTLKPWLKFDKIPTLEEYMENPFVVHGMETLVVKGTSVKVNGEIGFYHDRKIWQKLGTIAYESGDTSTNPVAEFLTKIGSPLDKSVGFENDGYLLAKRNFTSPASNQTYSTCSGDHNPIHTSALLADYAGLPGTITHGLWTSAAVRSLLETVLPVEKAAGIQKYSVQFTDMILPSEQLTLRVYHTGMKAGLCVLKVELTNSRGNKVLGAEALVHPVRSAYIFTGQGSQEVGMGMDLYDSSPIAKEIWDRADAHFLAVYGLSILEIVRRNPKNLTVHFGGPRGAKIRNLYLSLTYDTDKEKIRLFPEVTPSSTSYTFTSPAGLLSMTQFTQPALTLMEMAAFQSMRSKGLISEDCAFAGHSLGEYAALASVAQILDVEDLTDVVFYRGMCMQVAVKRDAEGRSPYGMAAVNPSRVHASFTQDKLCQLVKAVAAGTGKLLEIVNFNVKNWQYVVAGYLSAIETLTMVLNEIAKGKSDDYAAIISYCASTVPEDLQVTTRGVATIPLTGIDVPFHSSFLLNGVVPFRQFLMRKIGDLDVNPAALLHHYLPNLIAEPFALSKEYVQTIHQVSNSPILWKLINDWKEPKDHVGQKKLARLVLIELLSYQFASPVRWIETQDILFTQMKTSRIVEIGPSPTLLGMADRTLKLTEGRIPSGAKKMIKLLSHARDFDELHYIGVKGEGDEMASEPVEASEIQSAPIPQAQVALVASAPPAVATQTIDDLPIKAAEIVQIIVAQKTRRPASEIGLGKSIKEIAGGKSTLQNELIGDLGKEFGSGLQLEKPEEMSLDDLGAQIERGSWAKVPGKLVAGLISKLFSSKMPSGFNLSSAKALLQAEFGLTAKASETIFAISLLNEPANRFGSDDLAKTWFRDLTKAYLASRGITIAAASVTSGLGGATISSAELEKITGKQDALLCKQLQLYSAYLGEQASLDKLNDANAALKEEFNRLQAELDLWMTEHGGQVYADGIKPMFSPIKARKYDSWWNWARQAAARFVAGQEGVDKAMLVNRADEELFCLLEFVQAKDLLAAVKDGIKCGQPLFKAEGELTAPKTEVDETGKVKYSEVPRGQSYAEYAKEAIAKKWIHLRSRSNTEDPSQWVFDDQLTSMLHTGIRTMCTDGQTFAGKCVLMTGCGKGSIGVEMLKGLLIGGAKVVVTTSSYNRANLDQFRSLYEQHGSKGSALVVVPFNQGSVQDINALVAYIYGELQWELDAIVPFGAIPENGRSLTDLEDGKSELAHRLMLTNILRLIGAVAKAKEARRVRTRPAQVILPLSPNHGVFGYDGLYGESKIGLETLFNRWYSEGWSDFIAVVGAVIGWTRGTGLMNDNNLVAERIEALGVRTFSSGEMALNLLALMTPSVTALSETEPVYADFGGAMGKLKSLHLVTKAIRDDITARASRLARLHADKAGGKRTKPEQVVKRRANFKFGFNDLGEPRSYEEVTKGINSSALGDLLDLTRVVVVAGFGEVGPFGGSRTRWEMEASGVFSLEGCIELAWIMGLVKYDPKGRPGQYGGNWIDVASGEPIADIDIKARYEEHILAHTGIRMIEPASFGYEPGAKRITQELVLQEDLGPVEMSLAEARAFKLQHGEGIVISGEEGDRCLVRFKKGCTLFVPKALQLDRFVAGQLPTGWDAARYGVPQDIIEQVDPITLYVIVSTVEALVSAGITDPYEFYQYVHLAEIGNTMGGGMGGMVAQRNIYRNRFLDQPVISDVLQETFINTMPAWINLLLLSSAGPIKTPVGACATAVESVELGVDTILSGKAKVCIVGGYDNFTEESSVEFANMGATSNSALEREKGRDPKEMSRPMAASRGGFMESLGAGTHILMSAEMAIRMGCPIYGIVACTHMAMDKEGRSVPAPGQGVLTTARRVNPIDGSNPRILDMAYRWAQFQKSLQAAVVICDGSADLDAAMEYERRLQAEKRHWGSDFAAGDLRIAPIQAALAKFGLTVDDIDVASFHGTGTTANDINESEVVQKQLVHLGRTRGNMLPAVCQKYLTGHPKGAAAAWMFNGALQIMNSQVIPPNRNADSIDPKLQKFGLIYHPTAPIKAPSRIRSVLLKSFGFGQVGGEVLLVHPDYVLAALSKAQFQDYIQRRDRRGLKASTFQLESILQLTKLVAVKNAPPYPPQLESTIFLNPAARASYDPSLGSWSFSNADAKKGNFMPFTEGELASATAGAKGVGIDVQLIADLPVANSDFIQRNFTSKEIAYCSGHADPSASFAGRWAAKEAVVKALCSGSAGKPAWLEGPGAPLKAIEVLPGANQAPAVTVKGVPCDVKLSISHSGAYAAAIAILP